MVSDNHIIEIDEPDTDDKDLIKITLDKRNVELPIAYDHTIATRYYYTSNHSSETESLTRVRPKHCVRLEIQKL